MPDFRAADGTRLHYLDQGEGLPLIALPGLSRTSRDFDFLAPHFLHIRLIRPDYRGRGSSDWPGPESYTIPQESADVLALMDHLGLDRAALLGTSRGGLIALALAGMAKERLTGVAFNDIGPVIEAEGLAAIEGYLGRVPPQATLEEVAGARAEAMTEFRDVPRARWLEEADRLFAEEEGGLALRYDPRLREAVFGDGAAGPQPAPDLWPLFDQLAGKPLCLIRGEASNILSRATADEMARRRPDLIRAEVPGRGHVPFLDEPEALMALRAWLELL